MKFIALIAVIQDKDEEAAIKVAKEAGAGSVFCDYYAWEKYWS
jgi:hypothetical protein